MDLGKLLPALTHETLRKVASVVGVATLGSVGTLLTNIYLQNQVFVSGKELVISLAGLNNQNVQEVQLSYEALIRFLRKPTNQDSIRLEIIELQLHLNLLDILYELILFGWFNRDSAPDFMIGGFLDQLFRQIRCWDTEIRKPAAVYCFIILKEQLKDFLEVIFSQPLELYKDVGRLSGVVQNLLKQNIQEMLKVTKIF